MKKYWVLFVTLVFIAFPINSYSQRSDSQPARRDIEQYGLVGRVETLSYGWAAFSRKPNKQGNYKELKRTYIETVTFDINGKIILRHPLPYKCGMSWTVALEKQVSSYDDKGNLTEEIAYDYRGLFSGRSTFKYDANGNRIESAYYGPQGLMWVHQYDVKGREIEQARYNGEDSLEFRKVFIRNEKGNIIEKLTYDRNGSLKDRELSTYEYDDIGNWVKSLDWVCNVANEKLPCKPTRIDRRIITYHSEKDKSP